VSPSLSKSVRRFGWGVSSCFLAGYSFKVGWTRRRRPGEIMPPVMHISFLMELVHRGQQIKDALKSRACMRRRRRGNLRYRAPRFLNRGNKKPGWLPPSLQHRVDTTFAWVKRLCALAPVTDLAQELVKFDMQQMQAQAEGRDIAGVEYQQGTLQGYSVRAIRALRIRSMEACQGRAKPERSCSFTRCSRAHTKRWLMARQFEASTMPNSNLPSCTAYT
jgi:hypothetical protein